jgi:purine-binding chemotaxis protein CheW
MEFKPVVFYVGNEEYGVDITIVRGIEKVVPIVPVPNSNPIIKGIINLRGDIIPICSLRRKFGLPDVEHTDDTKFIIVKTDTILIGLEVDSVGEIQNVEESHIFEMPKVLKTEDTKYYSNVINMNGRLIVMLNINELMNSEEFAALEETISKM